MRLPPGPEEPRCEPMNIDSRDKPLHHGLDGVFCFDLESHQAAATNKILVPWSWRRILDVQTLIQCVDADEPTARFLAGMFSLSGLDFRPWLVETAQNYYTRVENLIQHSNKSHLSWVKWLSKHDSDVDKIVMAYLHFVTISTHFDPDYVDMYFEISCVVLRNNEEQYVFRPGQDLLAAEIAFRQENHGNKDATGPVLEQVRAYCDA